MVFDSLEDIIKKIVSPTNEEIIQRAIQIKEHSELHIAGIGIDKFVSQIDGIDNEANYKLKLKFANAITKTIYSRVLEPRNKIFSAKGGFQKVFIDSEEQKKTYFDKINGNLGKGFSLNEYLKEIWGFRGIFVDPLLMSYIEIDKDENPVITPYSVYIRINDTITRIIHDIDFNGIDKVEYVIFTPKANEYYNWVTDIDTTTTAVWRVVDDNNDYVIFEDLTKDKDDITRFTLNEELSIENYFGTVPACLASSAQDIKVMYALTTYCDDSLTIADNYLNDYIDERIYKKKISIPKIWEYKTQCTKCGGVKQIADKTGLVKCDKCLGTGENNERLITDILKLDILSSDVQSYIPPAGSVTLPTDIQIQMLTELREMVIEIKESIWGAGSSTEREGTEQTAFEISVRNEGMIATLNLISENYEIITSRLMDLLGVFYLKQNIISSWDKPIFKAGREYILSTANTAYENYLEAKTKKATNYQLDILYKDYLTVKYENNPQELQRQEKIFLICPVPHVELLDSQNILSLEQFEIKKNIEKYIIRIEKFDSKTIEEIEKELLTFAKTDINEQSSISIASGDGEDITV